MMNMWRFALARLVLITAFLVFSGCNSSPANEGTFERGKKAPDFKLNDLNGKSFSLASLSGNYVMLNFWTPYLDTNMKQLPEIAVMLLRFKTQGMAVVSVSPPGSEAAMQQAIQGKGYDWTFVVDSNGRVGSLFEISTYPTSIFLARGNVFASMIIGGSLTRSGIETAILDAMRL